MSTAGRLTALARYTWIGAWRRWIVFLPPAVFALMILAQIPRITYVRALFRVQGPSAEAIGAYAAFIRGNYGNLLFFGIVLAVALGAAGTGSRKLGSHILPLLARPVWRFEFVLGRMVGNGLVLLVYWLVPAIIFELLGVSLGAAVHVSPWAYVAPFLLHVLLLALGLAFGTFLPAVPATAAGLAATWLAAFVGGNQGSAVGWLRVVARILIWWVPPVGELAQSAAPFASPASVASRLALFVHAGAWIGILLVLAAWRFDRLDFTARGA